MKSHLSNMLMSGVDLEEIATVSCCCKLKKKRKSQVEVEACLTGRLELAYNHRFKLDFLCLQKLEVA